MTKAKKDKIIRMSLPPLFVILFMMTVFKIKGMYPFGTRSLSWCDMSQQVIPLLNQFKDILSGSGSIFYSLKNSGGMNFYGVFFFFLASPFTFLVKFVPKENMMMFANVLVMLKMAVCAFTASLCLTECRKKLDTPSTLLLSIMYPFCGYTMMYYQNIIWLDMMYLFPLLLIALHRITHRHKPLMYIIVLSAMMVVNYYICYMIVVFILLFTAVHTVHIMYVLKRSSDECGRVCRDIFIGSAISAFLTAAVWLPSLIQYLGSGRGETTVMQTLAESDMVSSYFTTVPMLFCTTFVFVIVAFDIISSRKRSAANNRMLIMLVLTLIPFLIEPINKMWHTGNYMSFPCRFGFITIFLAIMCTSYVLEHDAEYKKSSLLYYIGSAAVLLAIYLCYRYVYGICVGYKDQISEYPESLWGGETSFRLLLGIFFVVAATYGIIYFVYKKGFIHKDLFLALTAIVFILESYANIGVYIVYPTESNEQRNTNQSEVYDLEGRIDDEVFYRVKSSYKVYNNNMIGALGYNSISHYTSLNDRDYMFTMKRLGYSGVWMETSSVCGTRLTDALLSVKYEIDGKVDGGELVYDSKAGKIYELPDYLPMGLLLEKDSLYGCRDIPAPLTRTEIQQFLSENIFGEDIIDVYEPDEKLKRSKDGMYHFKQGDKIEYNIDTKGKRTVYLDCFDKLTNHLREPIFKTFSVYVDGVRISDDYPTNVENGLFMLYDSSDTDLNIRLICKKDTECYSFGVFGLDTERLGELCAQAEGVGLTEDGKGILSGSCTLDEGKTCFLSLPYSKGYTIRVNGKKIKYERALSDFISFDLEAGENDIVITYTPRGFTAGVLMSLIGALMLAAYIRFRKRLDKPLPCDSAAKYVMMAVSLLAMFAVYVLPIIVNICYIGKDISE